MRYSNVNLTRKTLLKYPIPTIKERSLIWERMRGMWKTKTPEPIKELKKMRGEWENSVR